MLESGFDFMSLMPLILIFVVFYFLLIRPQQKQMKERKNMLASLSRGDHVVTNGGLMGKITKIDEVEISVEIAKDVEVKVMRGMVNSVVLKTASASEEPAKAVSKPAKKKTLAVKKKTAKKTVSKK